MKRLLSLVLGLTAPLFAAAARPAWAEASTASGAAEIVAIASGAAQDLVVLDGGYAQGFRRGMVVLALADGAVKGRLLVAEARVDRAVALILELAPGQILEIGDPVRRSLIRL